MAKKQDIPETFVVRCARCGESDIGNPKHRQGLCEKKPYLPQDANKWLNG